MPLIFDGIKVLDFTSNLAGPTSTQMLADYGAEVIKIERPVAGDDSRAYAPRLEGQSIFSAWSNRNKKSVVLSLSDPRATEVLKRMVVDADIVVESYKPGTMKRFGLDYDAVRSIKPNIVYCSISACGQEGKYSFMPGFDLLAQAMSGVMDLCGEKDGNPVRIGVGVADYIAGLNAYGAMVSALHHRDRTGEGQYIDINLLDCMININTQIETVLMCEEHPTRNGNHMEHLCPYGVYEGKNGQTCIIGAYTDSMFRRLCKVMGMECLPAREGFRSNVERCQNSEAVCALIEGWLKQFDDINEPVKIMQAADICTATICATDAVARDPAHWQRGTFVEMPLPDSFKEHRTLKCRRPNFRFRTIKPRLNAAPDLGQHSYEILSGYGMTKEEIDRCMMDWNKGKK